MRKREKLYAILLAVCIIAALADAYSTWSNCKASGGITVRGVFTLECVRA